MKLYTEEQVKDMLELTNLNVQFHIDTMIPIELPSNEQIEELSKNTNFEYDCFNNGFIRGAEWIKEQILKQNQ